MSPEQETAGLAAGELRVEMRFRDGVLERRVVPMENPGIRQSHQNAPKPRCAPRSAPNAARTSISAAEYRAKMGWPPV